MNRVKTLTEEAKELQDNKALALIFERAREGIISRWETSKTPADREACWTDLHALNTLRDGINAAATRIEQEPVI